MFYVTIKEIPGVQDHSSPVPKRLFCKLFSHNSCLLALSILEEDHSHLEHCVVQYSNVVFCDKMFLIFHHVCYLRLYPSL